ncbi:MAG: DUF354 domain-containing protein [Candidatus Krumholzibacteriota bacterium]|nr:DUF354 domain-containing protein [Candidatus Krumholzibacteriota bacterium]
MKKIWIDIDNSPHVPLFRPVINELNRRDIECIITARDFAQTVHLLHLWDIPFRKIGKHGGKNKLKKIINLFTRANQVRGYIKKKSIDLALSHGSRTQLVAAKFSGIRSVVMMDYEYTESRIFNYLSNYMLIPEYIPDSRLRSVNINTEKVVRYSGFKEELYLDSFSPDMDFRENLNIDNQKILVTVRPSAMVGNYHDSMSETILLKIMGELTADKDVYPLIISRTDEDKDLLRSNFGDKVHFLEKAVDGLQLIWNSDLFISGGGSMNREAALLGVPAYSIFTGRKPYLDEYLQKKGKLTFIDTVEKIDLLNISKREIPDKYDSINAGLVEEVVDIILSL